MADVNAVEKKRYKLNAAALLAVLALAYIAFAFVTNTLPEPVKTALGVKGDAEKRAEAFAANYSDRLIYYEDPLFGFKVRYPIGYGAEEEGDVGARFRALAIVPGFSSEVMEVFVSNSSFDDNDFSELVANQSAELKIDFSGKKSLGGREVYLLNTRNESEFTDELLYTRNAFYNCRTPEGQAYSAALVFIVPEAVAADVELADYVVASFEC